MTFIHFLKLLQFTLNLTSTVNWLGNSGFRKYVFEIRDFVNFERSSDKPVNNYQLTNVHKFLQDLETLQQELILRTFTDKEFRRIAAIPKMSDKKVERTWVTRIWIYQELFVYQYPFQLPNLFPPDLSGYKFDMRFEILKVFCSVNLEKELKIDEFLQFYRGRGRNGDFTNIKREFLFVI
uniref:Uncharacterized protein n=1 Tax=Amicula sp. isolate GU52X-4 cfCalB7 TaxID=3003489 RepID=A0A9E8Z0I7_9STRA|nr:hypothetical protein [Amicula sp. isolate GU52X-4 cfCalB7]